MLASDPVNGALMCFSAVDELSERMSFLWPQAFGVCLGSSWQRLLISPLARSMSLPVFNAIWPNIVMSRPPLSSGSNAMWYAILYPTHPLRTWKKHDVFYSTVVRINVL